MPFGKTGTAHGLSVSTNVFYFGGLSSLIPPWFHPDLQLAGLSPLPSHPQFFHPPPSPPPFPHPPPAAVTSCTDIFRLGWLIWKLLVSGCIFMQFVYCEQGFLYIVLLIPNCIADLRYRAIEVYFIILHCLTSLPNVLECLTEVIYLCACIPVLLMSGL